MWQEIRSGLQYEGPHEDTREQDFGPGQWRSRASTADFAGIKRQGGVVALVRH